MTLAEEIAQLKTLPGLHPETIELLNRAVAAAKPKTTTMTTEQHLHAAAVTNLNDDPKSAIVHILKVLRKIPPHMLTTRLEEATAAQPINRQNEADRQAYFLRLARTAIGHIQAENPHYRFSISITGLAETLEKVEHPTA